MVFNSESHSLLDIVGSHLWQLEESKTVVLS